MSRINPTARGILILLAIATIVTALQLQLAVGVALTILQILFIVAIAFFLYTLWRNNRSEISTWSLRSRAVFYGAALLALVDLVVRWVTTFPSGGLEALVFFAVLAACVYAMVRIWRQEHTYGY